MNDKAWLEGVQTHPNEVFVGGRWESADGGQLLLTDPATEEILGVVCDAGPKAVDTAVRAARKAFDTGPWPQWSLERRAEVLGRLLDGVADVGEEFARTQTAQMGAPISVSRALVGGGARMYGAYLEGASNIVWSYLRRDSVGCSLVTRRPQGVVGVVIPWNGPLSSLVAKVVPALLMGCAVVVKPAPETPIEAGRFAEIGSEVGVPDGVINVVTGGVVTGEALVKHPGVDRISFTGSSAAGRRVGEICGHRLGRVSLELGGKSAAIVLPDAPLEPTARDLVNGNFFNSGQICVAVSRVLLPDSRHDEFLDAICDIAATMVVGDPRADKTQLGPLVSARHRERVEAHVVAGRTAGARLVFGGGRPIGLDRGWYVEPTVFADVTNDMAIAQEEIFGPVMSVLSYKSVDEAVAIANDSAYGLHGAVFAADPNEALAVSRRIRSGTVSVNTANLTPGTPYGGVGASGIGREHGREGLESFLDLHAYVIPAALADEMVGTGVPVA